MVLPLLLDRTTRTLSYVICQLSTQLVALAAIFASIT
jgi:hypothetical protein